MNLEELQSLYDFSNRTAQVTGGRARPRDACALVGWNVNVTDSFAKQMENGIEKPNVRGTLASKIPARDCARLNLGYLDPAQVIVDEWKHRSEALTGGRTDDGVLYVPRAGEILYRLKT